MAMKLSHAIQLGVARNPIFSPQFVFSEDSGENGASLLGAVLDFDGCGREALECMDPNGSELDLAYDRIGLSRRLIFSKSIVEAIHLKIIGQAPRWSSRRLAEDLTCLVGERILDGASIACGRVYGIRRVVLDPRLVVAAALEACDR